MLELVGQGLCNKEIAARLGISVSGAKKHLETLARRYDVTGRAALVRAALGSGDAGSSTTDSGRRKDT